ncbi:hypothetical protein ABZP36_028291 [Zizania latifolia]
MDATLISPCHLLLPLASRYLHRRRPSGRKIPRGRGGGSPAGVTTWSWSGRNAGRSRVNSLLGDGGGGGDGFLPEKRILKLDSAIQKRSIRERLELVADKCSYFFTNIVPSIDVSQMSKGMLLLLHAMMVKHHVSFVLKPTEGEGFDLGMKWSLGLFTSNISLNSLIAALQKAIIGLCLPAEWKDKKLPWDLDRNISTTHVYRGLLLIRCVGTAISQVHKNGVMYNYQNLLLISIRCRRQQILKKG